MRKSAFILVIFCALLSACGQKGALYLPNKLTQTPNPENQSLVLDAPSDDANDY